jgi:hypothetical protein
MANNRGTRGGKQGSKQKRNSQSKVKKKGEQSVTSAARADSPEGGEQHVRDDNKQDSEE